jgi:hypothetical protein
MNSGKDSSRLPYCEKLRDPRWQRRRLEVMNRDDFTCQRCGDDTSTLNVHHRAYAGRRDPWDYPLTALVTLCEDCHKDETYGRADCEKQLLAALRGKFFANGLHSIAVGVARMELAGMPDEVASAYEWAFANPAAQAMVLAGYRSARSDRRTGVAERMPGCAPMAARPGCEITSEWGE